MHVDSAGVIRSGVLVEIFWDAWMRRPVEGEDSTWKSSDRGGGMRG